jgi:hypothetical protein
MVPSALYNIAITETISLGHLISGSLLIIFGTISVWVVTAANYAVQRRGGSLSAFIDILVHPSTRFIYAKPQFDEYDFVIVGGKCRCLRIRLYLL